MHKRALGRGHGQAVQNQSLDVDITPRFAPASVAGTYRVTFTASASCTILSAEQKTRTYTAQIDQDAARLVVTLSGAPFVSRQNTFSGKVSGDTVTFDVGSAFVYYGYYYGTAAVQELLPSGQILGIFGTITAPVTPQSISATYAGGYSLRSTNGRPTTCAGNDNRVVFTRQ